MYTTIRQASKEVQESVTTVILDGYLGRRWGKVHPVRGVETIQQAVMALDVLHPGIRQAIEEKESTPTPYRYHVRVNKKTIQEEKVGLKVAGKTIRITPIVRGSANTKGIVGTIAGVALIIVGLVVTFASFGAGAAVGVPIILAGVGYLASGIASLIAGTPGVDDSSQNNKKKSSYAFNGPVNQTEQGGAVPILYGELIVGSATVSGSIVPSVIVTNGSASGYPTSSGGGGGGGSPFAPGKPVAANSYMPGPNEPARPVASAGYLGPNIAGAGGGAGAKTPSEAKITLVSTQTAQILDCISEGEVEGLGEHPLRNVFLNETPIENEDGTQNFKDFAFYFNSGTQDQNYIPGFASEEVTTPEGVEVKHGYPWVRHFSNTDLNAIRIVAKVPSLSKYKDNGDIAGAFATLKFEIRNNGSDWKDVYTDTIDGYTPSAYTRGYEIPLDDGPGPWDLRVTRVTDDSDSSKLNNKTVIDSKSEIIYGKFRHPGRAMAGIKVKAEQFSEPPTRAYRMKGVKVLVPTIYDPISRTYDDSRVWDGGFKVAWTNNPAWCWYDLLTNADYGLGKFLKVKNIDRYSLMKIARYCDQLVPDSVSPNGMQPRHTMNHYIQSRAEAIKVISDMASNFRAMLYYVNGAVTAVQDRVADRICANYGPANVENGRFTYAGVDNGSLYNACYVRWNDPDNLSKTDVEPSEHQEDIAANGLNDTQVTGIGVATRGEARRLGEATIQTAITRDETCTFRTGFLGGFRMPGDVIAVSNPWRSGERFTGLVKSVVGTVVTLDRPATIEPDKVYQVSGVSLLTDENGNKVTQTVLRTVTTGPGEHSVLNVSVPFDVNPTGESVYILLTAAVQPELWRVLTVSQDNIQAHEVTCLKYNASLYDAVDRNYKLEYPPTSDLPDPGICQPPGAVTVTEAPVVNPEKVQRVLAVSWVASPDRYVSVYKPSYRYEGGNWLPLATTASTALTLPINSPGKYEFQIVARNINGDYSAPSIGSYGVDDTNPLALFEVTGLQLFGQAKGTEFGGRDISLTWRTNSLDPLTQSDFGNERFGAGTGGQDPSFQDYEIRFRRLSDNKIVHRATLQQAQYTLTYEKNCNAIAEGELTPSGPYRALRVEVVGHDTYGGETLPAVIVVSNPIPKKIAPEQVTAIKSASGINFKVSGVDDLDYANLSVFGSGLLADVAADIPASNFLLYRGSSLTAFVVQVPGSSQYYRLGASDSFSATEFVLSDPILVTNDYLDLANFTKDFRDRFSITEQNAAGAFTIVSSPDIGNGKLATRLDAVYALMGDTSAIFTTEITTLVDAYQAEAHKREDLSSQIDDSRAKLETDLRTLATDDYASATYVTTLGAYLKGVQGAVQINEGVVATVDGIKAFYTVELTAQGRVSGVRMVNDGHRADFIIQTDVFKIVTTDTQTPITPFEVRTDTSGPAIVFGADAMSDNYVKGVSGWRGRRNGKFEINVLKLRNPVIQYSLASPTINPNTTGFNTSVNVAISHPLTGSGGAHIYYTLDGTTPTIYNTEYVPGTTTLTLTNSATVRAIAYIPDPNPDDPSDGPKISAAASATLIKLN